MTLLCALAMPIKAQVMWNIKGGIMQRSFYDEHTFYQDDDTRDKRIDWMAGIELEIPLSRKLNIETGLRYRDHLSLIYTEDEYYPCVATPHLELPLRLAYKQPLGKLFSLHAGIGPYASYLFGGGAHIGDDKWNNKLQVGLEPSIAINWACLSLGTTYNIPCLYKGYTDENKPAIMLTLGIRFKSKAWKYIGAGLAAVATVGAAAGMVLSASNSDNNYTQNSFSPSAHDDNDSSSSSQSNQISDNNSQKHSYEFYKNMYEKWERNARNAYEALTKLTEKSYSYKEDKKDKSGSANGSWGIVSYTGMKKNLRTAQKEMRDIRTKARRDGYNIPQSNYETVTVSY